MTDNLKLLDDMILFHLSPYVLNFVPLNEMNAFIENTKNSFKNDFKKYLDKDKNIHEKFFIKKYDNILLFYTSEKTYSRKSNEFKYCELTLYPGNLCPHIMYYNDDFIKLRSPIFESVEDFEDIKSKKEDYKYFLDSTHHCSKHLILGLQSETPQYSKDVTYLFTYPLINPFPVRITYEELVSDC